MRHHVAIALLVAAAAVSAQGKTVHPSLGVCTRQEEFAKRQRIGSQGLSCSIENGGYGAHLHFGLGDGPFRRPAGLAAGDKANLDLGDGQKQQTPVLRLVYGEKTNSHGWPLTAFVVQMPDGKERTIEVPEQQAQRELSWFSAYVKNCRGWCNPQDLLPELVAPKRAPGR